MPKPMNSSVLPISPIFGKSKKHSFAEASRISARPKRRVSGFALINPRTIQNTATAM